MKVNFVIQKRSYFVNFNLLKRMWYGFKILIISGLASQKMCRGFENPDVVFRGILYCTNCQIISVYKYILVVTI